MAMGPQDAVTGEFLQEPGLEEGHWYLDENQQLFIVPNDRYGIAEIEGPDGEVLDKLNSAYRSKAFSAIDPDVIAMECGLDVVSPVLKRFDPDCGYYSA